MSTSPTPPPHHRPHRANPPPALGISSYKSKCQTPCHCKCTPKDFEKTTLSPDELLHERVKILKNVNEVNANTTESSKVNGYPSATELRTSRCDADPTTDNNNVEDWSLMLIGLAQIHPAAHLVHMDPFEAVPTIAVVPPTPDALNSNSSNCKQNMTLNWNDSNRLNLGSINESHDADGDEYSPDNSPEDEIAEPPYRALSTGMKRYGTMSSLERVPSDETDKTYNSSEEDSEGGE